MKIHEYQAKQLFRRFGIPVPEGHVVTSQEELAAREGKLEDRLWVVKSQVHAGGRGKGTISKDSKTSARGIELARTGADALAKARAMLGGTLVTRQTGKQGKQVRKLLIEQGVDIAAEFYLAVILDREKAKVALMASTEGGTEIEEVAQKHPEKIHTVHVDPLTGYKEFHGRNLALRLGLPFAQVKPFAELCGNLYRLFVDKDSSLAEVNPLVLTKQGTFAAIDGKVNFDDNALYRHPDIAALEDRQEEVPSEVEAADAKLTYIRLDGDIGCLVNGAGLAMATMDTIKEFGGEPANFLDVGGTATAENVAKSFEIMLRDNVRGILVNVFGGIVRCDVVAQGLVEALGKVKLSIPLVVRLAGNRKQEAEAILAGSGLAIVTADSLKDGAHKVVELCHAGKA